MKKKGILIVLLVMVAALALGRGLMMIFTQEPRPSRTIQFDGNRAYEDVKHQTSLGPRTPGSESHAQTVEWITNELEQYGWQIEVQQGERMGHEYKNIVAKSGSGEPWIIVGAHYDTRLWADSDPDEANHNQPVPGANDGASGVAVLMELARTLPRYPTKEIWLVFFDLEDQGRIPDWDWILGSRDFADNLEDDPDVVVIVDMIGDSDLNIYLEKNSDEELSRQIWDKAAELGFDEQFIPEYKYAMLDDHTPFVERGIPVVEIIDFDYPYWHTVEDTDDKVSPESLQAVGQTLLAWLNSSQ